MQDIDHVYKVSTLNLRVISKLLDRINRIYRIYHNVNIP